MVHNVIEAITDAVMPRPNADIAPSTVSVRGNNIFERLGQRSADWMGFHNPSHLEEPSHPQDSSQQYQKVTA